MDCTCISDAPTMADGFWVFVLGAVIILGLMLWCSRP